MPKAPSSSMASSPRPKANPRNEASSSSSPRATTSSPRPKANPTLAAAAKPAASAPKSAPASPLGKDNQGQGLNNATSAKPGTRPPIPPKPPAGQTPGDPVDNRAPDNPAAARNPNLPADSVQASRGERRTLIDALQEPGANRSAQKYRGSVLSSVYKLPANPANTAKTLQQFNGPRGQRMTLGA
jgi:hypothetical protein